MTDDARPPELDLEALKLGPMAHRARTATFAPNWKSVLAADAFVGVILLVIGAVVANWITWIGWCLIAAGIVYLCLVGRRFLQWRWLRRQAGLD